MSSSARGFLGAALLAAGLAGCSGNAHAADRQLFEAVEPHMGTLVRIKLYAAGARQAKAAFRAAFDRIAQLDDALSDYKPASELNRICRTAVARPVEAGADLFRVLEASQKLAGETDGAFDVTLGPVIRLWREARNTNRLPDSAVLREAAGRCGYRKLHLDPAKRTVMLDEAGMQLDAGGIAKGYAADAAFLSVLELSNAAVSTSGDQEQHLDIDGTRYSHIIDPATGMGLSRPISVAGITVTVIARYGIDADGLATAVSVLGGERGIALIEKQPGAAALVMTDHVVESSRWPGYQREFFPTKITPRINISAPRQRVSRPALRRETYELTARTRRGPQAGSSPNRRDGTGPCSGWFPCRPERRNAWLVPWA
jgi:thiamine biosynthesis lipoprotein